METERITELRAYTENHRSYYAPQCRDALELEVKTGELLDLLAAAEREKRLRELLAEAVECIEVFHGPVAWGLYQQSPEMQRFNAALNANPAGAET